MRQQHLRFSTLGLPWHPQRLGEANGGLGGGLALPRWRLGALAGYYLEATPGE